MKAKDAALGEGVSAGERVFSALAGGTVCAVIGYLWIRSLDGALFARIDPRAIVSAESQQGARMLAALFIGGLGAFGARALCLRAPSVWPKVLVVGIGLAALGLFAQAAWMP